MLTALVRDLHALHPDKFLIGVETQRRDLWENNPHLDWSLCRFGKEATAEGRDAEAEFIALEYPLIHKSNQQPWHFIHAMHRFVGGKLGLDLYPTAFKGDVGGREGLARFTIQQGWFIERTLLLRKC